MKKGMFVIKLSGKGQSLMELVVGVSLITIVVGAVAVITTYGLRNSQFSKNQAQATKLAQENIEKVRTIKSSNYGICFIGLPACSSWEAVWTLGTESYSKFETDCAATGCKFSLLLSGCTIPGDGSPQVCLQQLSATANPVNLQEGFTYEILISNEPEVGASQKRVTSRVFWTDTTGDHSSDLVTVFSKL